MSKRKYECPKSMIFQISRHRVNHFERVNYQIFVKKVTSFTPILPYFQKCTLMLQIIEYFWTKLVHNLSVGSTENNSVLPSLLFGTVCIGRSCHFGGRPISKLVLLGDIWKQNTKHWEFQQRMKEGMSKIYTLFDISDEHPSQFDDH